MKHLLSLAALLALVVLVGCKDESATSKVPDGAPALPSTNAPAK